MGKHSRKLDKNMYLSIVLGVLIGIAIVFGVSIIKRTAPFEEKFAGEELSFEKDIGNEPSLIQSSPGREEALRLLSEEERAVLDTPLQGASEEELFRHFELARPLARRADSLNISNCVADPVVFQVAVNEEITVMNNDDIAHTIQMDPTHFYLISAKGTKEITPNFSFGAGMYGYGCDNSPGAAGLFFVTE